ncbi:MAG TPA: EAL domain-containing protein, partial [Acidimicrobiales bacterium]|nr:EAL domain-containing protein [Acidimicrobiales bacterium]
LRQWNHAGLNLRVAVNLPVQALLDADFPDRVLGVLRKGQVNPEALTFEITESGIMCNPERMISVLSKLAEAGIRLAIDDFGTGYSSLAYLQRLPVTELKIDKSFVLSLTTDRSTASIVRSITELGRNLGLTVVAEGVEDERCLDALRAIGCDHAQGYHFSKAIAGAELTAWLRLRGDAPWVRGIVALDRAVALKGTSSGSAA